MRCTITCCNGCIPPKRNSICHSVCKDYKKEAEEWKAIREQDYKMKRAAFCRASTNYN